MAADLVAQRTPLESREAIEALTTAVRDAGGSERTARFLVTQSYLETGGWRGVWRYNLGNLRGSYQGQSTSIPGATEYDATGKLVPVPQGFAAYPSPAEGARAMASLIRRLYPAAWRAATLEEYVRGLSSGTGGRSYFGVPGDASGRARAVAHYLGGMRRVYAQLFGDTGGGAGSAAGLLLFLAAAYFLRR